MEQRELASHGISHHLEPVCPRDDHKMKFDSDEVRWEQTADNATIKVAMYHCGYNGRSVRYVPEHGYFTVVKAPDLPVFVEEPRPTHCSARFTIPGYTAEQNRMASDLNGAAAAKAATTVARVFPETGCASKSIDQSGSYKRGAIGNPLCRIGVLLANRIEDLCAALSGG
jgi:hypothetical protein